MRDLAATFQPFEYYGHSGDYTLFPFRFLRLDRGRVVITNLAGQHLVITDEILSALVEHRLVLTDPIIPELESVHFLARGCAAAHQELLAAQIRTRQSRLPELATLHIFVVTLRCDQSCIYCQVSHVSENRTAFDMSEKTADRAVDLMLSGPARQIKIEFQGGESLLNFPIIRRIVARVEAKAGDRETAFVAATNLSVLTDEMLEFFTAHSVSVSTSLDGPAILHNHNRPRPGHDAHRETLDGIRRCRKWLGPDSVSALMTCSAESLDQPEAIIDEYVAHGFREIFLREISPYGFAVPLAKRVGYDPVRFLDFYRRGLAHVLALNHRGIPFREVYASLLLRRMLTSYPTGYVDLQSPTGAGFGALVYNYDGAVYASDEGRMLAEMGDFSFRLGNVHQNTWADIYLESPILDSIRPTRDPLAR